MTDHEEHDRPDQDLADLRDLLAGRDPSALSWEPPPPGLWDRIEAEVSAEATTEDDDDLEDDPMPPSAPAPVLPLPARRRPPLVWVAAAAAAVLVAGLGGWALTRSGGGSETELASVELDQLGEAGSGAARLVERDGSLTLQVDTADLDPGDGFLELWVIDPEVSRLISLGPLRPDGVYDLPPGFEPSEFPIVDISLEHFDGDPTHSGNSLLRGQLEL